jgi:hypothetical protein
MKRGSILREERKLRERANLGAEESGRDHVENGRSALGTGSMPLDRESKIAACIFSVLCGDGSLKGFS